ncbi:MAG: dnaE2 [Chthonomonadaceae bacterium]|nr:dnaE2 [Chthonomonadaceae bacterium]
MPALALTDHNSLAAAVKFVACCKDYGLQPILGSEVTMEDGSHLTLLAKDRRGYGNLCRLITAAYAHGGRLSPQAPWQALEGRTDGLICLTGCRKGRLPTLIRSHRYAEAQAEAERLRTLFGIGSLYLELQEDLDPDSHQTCLDLVALGQEIGLPVVATNNVHYVRRADYITHDILRAIATLTDRDAIHPDRPLNAERSLKSPAKMADLFAWCPEAIRNTVVIAEQCTLALPARADITPRYALKEGWDAPGYLRHLAFKGAAFRYRGLTPAVNARLEHELALITELGYADYFLMVWEIVRWARKSGFRATGRGSAADSCVAYALTLTDVDVIQRDLPFSRFLVPGKTPDIDMDFPSEHRDDVFRYIIRTYGEEHVGMACTFHTYWSRSAVRDIGKALAIAPDVLATVSRHLNGFIRADQIDQAFDRFAELTPFMKYRERFRLLFTLCEKIAGFPRHLGTHSSGIVISRVPLATLAPLVPSARGLTQIWTLDKDDAEELGAIKFDVLSLRTLSAVGDAERAIQAADPGWRYDRLPLEDPATYDAMRAGQSVGVFQFESPAQMALAGSLQPEHFEDLVASIALIRPGPIRGNGVQRFVAARNGWARADCLHPMLQKTLDNTYGVIVFQEQVVQIFALMTGCSEAEGDKMRKSLARHHKAGTMETARMDFLKAAMARHRDLTLERANLLFDQLAGWSGFGFMEGHAAAFAQTGVKTAYLSVHNPAAYFAGLMNHQPMGYYNANSLAAEARRRGIQILPVDINASEDRCRPVGEKAIRLGFRLVAEMREEDIKAVLEARGGEPFRSLLEFCCRAPLHRSRLENLILCGAFDALHTHRRGLTWRLEETQGLATVYRANENISLQAALRFDAVGDIPTPVADSIDDFSLWERFLWTWRLTGVCAECHVFTHLRSHLARRQVLTTDQAMQKPPGTRVTVAGLNIRPHRPPTRSGKPVLFASVEDEMGLLQVVCFGAEIATLTPVFLTAPAILVRGVLGRKGRAVSLRVEKAKLLRMEDLAERLPTLPNEPPTELAVLDSMPHQVEVFGR